MVADDLGRARPTAHTMGTMTHRPRYAARAARRRGRARRAAGRAARLLRRRRPGRGHRREGARPLRRAGLRPQADRAQQARRAPTSSRAARSSSRSSRRCPTGATVVFSAHGVSPEVHRQAEERELKTIDATCPLVTKVHHEAKRFAGDDYDILLIGHAGPRGGRGHRGRGARAHPARREPGRRRQHRGPRPGQGRLALPDHALGRRDPGDRGRDPRAVPAAARPAERRHLLRHPEPPARGQGDLPRLPTW